MRFQRLSVQRHWFIGSSFYLQFLFYTLILHTLPHFHAFNTVYLTLILYIYSSTRNIFLSQMMPLIGESLDFIVIF